MRNDSLIKGTLRDDNKYESVLLKLPKKEAHGVLTFILTAHNKLLVDAKFLLDFSNSFNPVKDHKENEQVTFESVPAPPLKHNPKARIAFK
jgi:hypothetical protein